MERIPSLVQCQDAQVKVILKAHVHKDLDHRSDIGEGAADLGVIDYLWASLQLENRALGINSKRLLGIIK